MIFVLIFRVRFLPVTTNSGKTNPFNPTDNPVVEADAPEFPDPPPELTCSTPPVSWKKKLSPLKKVILRIEPLDDDCP